MTKFVIFKRYIVKKGDYMKKYFKFEQKRFQKLWGGEFGVVDKLIIGFFILLMIFSICFDMYKAHFRKLFPPTAFCYYQVINYSITF